MREGLQLGLAAADPHEIRRGVQDLAVALEAEHRTMARRWMPRDVSRSAWRHRRKMTPNEIRCLDLDEVRRRYDGGTTEVRRRSERTWSAVPPERLGWRPDLDAMSCIEMVRHVLEGEYLYLRMLRTRRSVDDSETPFTSAPHTTVAAELARARPHRRALLDHVRSLRAEEPRTVMIDRSDVGYVRSAGDFILRMAYHEAVHAGQRLGYLRAANAARPVIWD
jgi:uncharacterized damage-inducible protein DinB